MLSDKLIYSSVSSKLLIAGGYSVLYPNNVGLSLATNQQFYGTLLDVKQDKDIKIIVECKQINTKYIYKVDLESNEIEQENKQNEFIYASIKSIYWFMIQLRLKIQKQTLHLYILNDEHFYSSNSQLDQSQQNNNKFKRFKPLDEIHKTGLGSSSCVVSVVIDLLMQFYQIDQKYRYLISLISNFTAQNKIGSGFDICTSIYGSQLFRRVDQQLISIIYEQFYIQSHELIRLIDDNLEQINQIEQIHFNPQNLNIYMLDIQQGSNTRIMVNKVIQYFKSNSEQLQQFITESNHYVNQILNCLQSQQYQNLKMNCHKYRQILKQIGNKSGVDIEPDSYSEVFDQLLEYDSIYYCVCPGAGGYDGAIIICDSQVSSQDIHNMLDSNTQQTQIQIIQLQLQEHDYKQQQRVQVLDYLLSQ